jgi:hypothetical protein
MTKSAEIATEITALLRARTPLLWIATREEGRAERYLIEAAASAGYLVRMWDAAQGVTELGGKPAATRESADPATTLAMIAERAQAKRAVPERCVWIMRDLAPWLTGTIGMTTCRQVRNLARLLPTTPNDRAQAFVILTPSTDIPPELADQASVIDWPLPDRAEIAQILDAAIAVIPAEHKDRVAFSSDDERNAAIDAAVGLSGEEAEGCFATSLVQSLHINPAAVAREKKRMIARERVLEWHNPLPDGLDAVGGLDRLKSWLTTRALAYTPAARSYGLPAPRGILIGGISGTGKSLTAKAVATAWGVPLLRVDLGALRSKWVGESEANLRRALRVIEAIGRCVVWLDEVEKSLVGATQGAADGGVSADALGAILSWMQERAGEAFVIATCNDVTALPPEFTRKGRFDELWWVDLPNTIERREIVLTALRAHGRNKIEIDLDCIVKATADFTGAEITALIPEAMFAAFADGEREITTQDILAATQNVVPLSKTMSDRIDSLRKWADGRARPATTPEASAGTRTRNDRPVVESANESDDPQAWPPRKP